MVYCTGLLNRQSETARKFKSCASRQLTASDIAVYVEIVWQPGKTGIMGM